MALEAKRKAAGEEHKVSEQEATELEATEPEAIEPEATEPTEAKTKHNIFFRKLKIKKKNINE